MIGALVMFTGMAAVAALILGLDWLARRNERKP